MSFSLAELGFNFCVDTQTHLSLVFYCQLAKQLLLLIVLRKKLIGVYQALNLLTITKEFDSEIQALRSASLNVPATVTHPFLAQIRQNILFEVLLLDKAVHCESYLAQCDAANSVFYYEQLTADLQSISSRFLSSHAADQAPTVQFAQLPLGKMFSRLADVFREKLLLYFGTDPDSRITSALVLFEPTKTVYYNLYELSLAQHCVSLFFPHFLSFSIRSALRISFPRRPACM